MEVMKKKFVFLCLLNSYFCYSKTNNECKSCPKDKCEVNFLKEKINLNYSLLAGLNKNSVSGFINLNYDTLESKDVEMKNILGLSYSRNLFKFVDKDDYILIYWKDIKKPVGIIEKKNLFKEEKATGKDPVKDKDLIFGYDLISSCNKKVKFTLMLNNGNYPYLINVRLHHFLQYAHPYLHNGYIIYEKKLTKNCFLVPLNYKKFHIMPKLYFYDLKNKLLLRRSVLRCSYVSDKKDLKKNLNDGKEEDEKKGIVDTQLDIMYNIMCLESRDDNVPTFSRYAVFGRYLVKICKEDEDLSETEIKNLIGEAVDVGNGYKYNLVSISNKDFDNITNNDKYSEVINCNFYKNRLESDYLKTYH